MKKINLLELKSREELKICHILISLGEVNTSKEEQIFLHHTRQRNRGFPGSVSNTSNMESTTKTGKMQVAEKSHGERSDSSTKLFTDPASKP